MNKAKALGAVDKTHFNLPASVEAADVVLLCLPLDQVEDTLKAIAVDLREDAVVMDVSPLKSVVSEWFEKYVPAGRHYVGLVPAINPLMFGEQNHGVESARADLFDKATIGIAAPGNTRPQAIKLAEDLIHLLGGDPLFLDLLEADGMLASTHILPQVMSVALLNATVGQPGWQEARRFAGRPYAMASAAVGDDTLESLEQSLMLNPEKSVYLLNQAIGALTHLRDSVQSGNSADVERRLHMAFDDHATWLRERRAAEWQKTNEKDALPQAGDWLKRLFIGERPKKK
jgi:prephenate dehydrogenase